MTNVLPAISTSIEAGATTTYLDGLPRFVERQGYVDMSPSRSLGHRSITMPEMCSATTDHIHTEGFNMVTGARSQLLDILKRAGTRYKMAGKSTDDKHLGEVRSQPSIALPYKPLPKSISVNDFQVTARSRPQTSGLGLRRVRDSLHDLRIANQKHTNQYRKIADGQRILDVPKSLHRRQSSASLVISEYDGAKQEKRIPYKSYQDLHILSMYEEEEGKDGKASSTTRNVPLLPSQLRNMSLPHSTLHNAVSSPSLYSSSSGSSSPRPQTPHDDMRLPAYDWEDAEYSDNEYLRGKHARCVQVVQQHRSRDTAYHSGENEIMLATVLVGPGKPKLVQIPRPPSITALTRQFSTSRDLPPVLTSSGPITPTHETSQLSKFSPWDTPHDGTPFSDISTIVSAPITIARRSPRLSIRTDFPDPKHDPTSISPETDLGSISTVYKSNQDQQDRQLDDPFSSPHSHRSIYTNCGSSMILSPARPAPAVSRTTTRAIHDLENARKQHLKDAITASARVLDVLSYHNLHLLTPELTPFRVVLPEHNDERLLVNLRRVFPHSSAVTLPTLAAWLIVDQYLTHLLGQKVQYPSPMSISDKTRAFTRCTNSPNLHWSSHTTPQLSQACQNYWGRLNSIQHTPSNCYPPISSACSTSALSQQQFYHSHMRSPAISMPAPLEPHSYSAGVPNKAKTLLGIGISNTTLSSAAVPVETELQCLEHRAKSVHESLGEIGQKLVGDLLGNYQQHSQEISSSGSRRPRSRRGSVSSVTAGNFASSCRNQENDHERMTAAAAAAALWQACRAIISLIAETGHGDRHE